VAAVGDKLWEGVEEEVPADRGQTLREDNKEEAAEEAAGGPRLAGAAAGLVSR